MDRHPTTDVNWTFAAHLNRHLCAWIAAFRPTRTSEPTRAARYHPPRKLVHQLSQRRSLSSIHPIGVFGHPANGPIGALLLKSRHQPNPRRVEAINQSAV